MHGLHKASTFGGSGVDVVAEITEAGTRSKDNLGAATKSTFCHQSQSKHHTFHYTRSRDR